MKWLAQVSKICVFYSSSFLLYELITEEFLIEQWKKNLSVEANKSKIRTVCEGRKIEREKESERQREKLFD